MSRGKTVRRDHGYEQLRKNLKVAAKGAGVSVGVHAREGSEQHKGNGEPVSVLDVAIWNELGIGVPERPFVRTWFDGSPKEHRELLQKALVSVVQGKRTLPEALELVGLKFQGEIQKALAAGTLGLQANAESTVEKKGSSVPLIDEGQLRQSLTYLVHDASTPK